MLEEYRELYQERAAIIQFDGGFSQKEAEQKALSEITNLWLKKENLSMTNASTYNAITKFKREIIK